MQRLGNCVTGCFPWRVLYFLYSYLHSYTDIYIRISLFFAKKLFVVISFSFHPVTDIIHNAFSQQQHTFTALSLRFSSHTKQTQGVTSPPIEFHMEIIFIKTLFNCFHPVLLMILRHEMFLTDDKWNCSQFSCCQSNVTYCTVMSCVGQVPRCTFSSRTLPQSPP